VTSNNSHVATLILSGAMIATAVDVAAPRRAVAQSTVPVAAVIRDFSASHPDFGLPVLSVSAHFAGTVGLGLDASQRPTFSTDGFEVVTEWTERGGNPISPHMYRDPLATVLRLAHAPSIDKDVTIDTWDPAAGPYPLGAGKAPRLEVQSVMPQPTVPVLGASVGDVFISSSGVLSSNLHCNNLGLQKNITVTIFGSVTIVCEGSFWMNQDSHIALAPGSTLSLYVMGGPSAINQGSTINTNTMDPTRCTVTYLGEDTFHINRDSAICGTVIAPNAAVHLHQNDHIYGSLIAGGAIFNQQTGLHQVDNSTFPSDQCGVSLVDTVGVRSFAGNGGITSAATFREWFRDVLGVNQSLAGYLTLVDNGSGIYEYRDNDFHPIDSMLLGNDGDTHNENFTLTMNVEFVYAACMNQFIEVEGGDGLWVFIDGTLVIDLGGIDNVTKQYVDLDRVGSLVDGGVHEMKLFYASRNMQNPTFVFRTNVTPISAVPPFNVSVMAD